MVRIGCSYKYLAMADGATNPDNVDEAFVYTGEGGQVVPQDVVRVRVHPSVTILPDGVFYGRLKLVEVELSEGLLEIRECAFSDCSALRRISIPSTVTLINNNAFAYCDKMEEVNLREGLVVIESCAFESCKSLKRMTIPSTVTVIKSSSFAECDKLEEVELHEGLLEIGNYAFHYCNLLKQIKKKNKVRCKVKFHANFGWLVY